MPIYKISTVVTNYNGQFGASRDQACLHFIEGIGYTDNTSFIDHAAKAGHTVDTIPADYAKTILDRHSHWTEEARRNCGALTGTPLRDSAANPDDPKGPTLVGSPNRDAAVKPRPMITNRLSTLAQTIRMGRTLSASRHSAHTAETRQQ